MFKASVSRDPFEQMRHYECKQIDRQGKLKLVIFAMTAKDFLSQVDAKRQSNSTPALQALEIAEINDAFAIGSIRGSLVS